MAYERKTWLDKNSDGTIPNGAIPLSADNLNRMEDGISEALERVEQCVKIGNVIISDTNEYVNLGYQPKFIMLMINNDTSPMCFCETSNSEMCKILSDGFELNPQQTIITNSNIREYFYITDSSYYFKVNNTDSQFVSNNQGRTNSEAKTILVAKQSVYIDFIYGYSSEKTHDKFYLTVGDKIIEDGSSSPTSGEKVEKRYTGYINAGDSIIFKYSKDGSVDSGDDCGYFKNITISYIGANVTYLALK